MFSNCTSLESITIPANITSIGSYAFEGCTSLTYYEYENGYYLGNDNNHYLVLIKAIDTSVTSFTINENTKIIYSYALAYCRSLKSITIPDSVTSIDSSVFSGCTSLESVIIGNGVSTIGSSAFYGCTSLKSIVISDSVTYINYRAFYDCTSLESVYYTGTVDEWNNITIDQGNGSLNSATIYYFAEKDSTTESGNYWYYDGTGNIVTWSV